jgi:hypothetical protein
MSRYELRRMEPCRFIGAVSSQWPFFAIWKMNFIIIVFEKGRMSTTGTGMTVFRSREASVVCGSGVELTYAPF